MIKCLFTGQTNSGKTALIMALARFNSTAHIIVKQSGSTQSHNISSLMQDKVSSLAYHTEQPAHYYFLMGYQGMYYKYDMIDTIGLIDDVYARSELRNAVWEVFYHLSQCDILVHTVNAINLVKSNGSLTNVEQEIITYQINRHCPCIICATFCDQSQAKRGVKIIRKMFPNIPVIALSNTTYFGLKRLNKLLTNYAAEII